MICKHCKTVLPENANFCFNCGEKVVLTPQENEEMELRRRRWLAQMNRTGHAIMKAQMEFQTGAQTIEIQSKMEDFRNGYSFYQRRTEQVEVETSKPDTEGASGKSQRPCQEAQPEAKPREETPEERIKRLQFERMMQARGSWQDL